MCEDKSKTEDKRVETTAEISFMSSQRVIGVDVGGAFTKKTYSTTNCLHLRFALISSLAPWELHSTVWTFEPQRSINPPSPPLNSKAI